MVKPAAGASEAAVKKYKEWIKEDAKARSIIRRTLDDVAHAHVQDCKTAKDIMERIRQLRDPRTTDVLMTSITAFFAEKWKDDDDVTSFLARLAVHAGKVNAVGDDAKINDKFVIRKDDLISAIIIRQFCLLLVSDWESRRDIG